MLSQTSANGSRLEKSNSSPVLSSQSIWEPEILLTWVIYRACSVGILVTGHISPGMITQSHSLKTLSSWLAQKPNQLTRSAANPKDDIFPGIEHGLNGHHDIFYISEDQISALPKDSIALLSFAGMCNDFSKLRLLPDRLDYKGPPRKPGVDPRRGLDGKYGKT